MLMGSTATVHSIVMFGSQLKEVSKNLKVRKLNNHPNYEDAFSVFLDDYLVNRQEVSVLVAHLNLRGIR